MVPAEKFMLEIEDAATASGTALPTPYLGNGPIGFPSGIPRGVARDFGLQDDWAVGSGTDSMRTQLKLEELERKVCNLEEEIQYISQTCSLKLYDLSDERYQLNEPLQIVVKCSRDECLALFPELELYGEGDNEFEAIADLKNEILDLYDDIIEEDDENLGNGPLSWKRILTKLIVTI